MGEKIAIIFLYSYEFLRNYGPDSPFLGPTPLNIENLPKGLSINIRKYFRRT